MMPTCQWKRCKRVGEHKVDVRIEFEHPYLCDKHFNRLLNKLQIVPPKNQVNKGRWESK